MHGLLCPRRWQGVTFLGTAGPTAEGNPPSAAFWARKRDAGSREDRWFGLWPRGQRGRQRMEFGTVVERPLDPTSHANPAAAPAKPQPAPGCSRFCCVRGNRSGNGRPPARPPHSHSHGGVNHGLTPGLHRPPALCKGLALSSRTVTPAADLQPGWEQDGDTPDTSSPSRRQRRQRPALSLLLSSFPGHRPSTEAAGLDVALLRSASLGPRSPLRRTGQELHSAVTQP